MHVKWSTQVLEVNCKLEPGFLVAEANTTHPNNTSCLCI